MHGRKGRERRVELSVGSVRQRVFVDRIVGDLAALTSGPKPGVKVVSTGAAELFGTEFGGAK